MDRDDYSLPNKTPTILKDENITVKRFLGLSDKQLREFGFTDEEIVWRSQALCKGMGESIFFPDRGYSMLPAYVVCHSCPVRIECLDSALEWGDIHGIRAGFTPYEREKIQEKIEAGFTLIQAMQHWDKSREEKLRKARTRL